MGLILLILVEERGTGRGRELGTVTGRETGTGTRRGIERGERNIDQLPVA